MIHKDTIGERKEKRAVSEAYIPSKEGGFPRQYRLIRVEEVIHLVYSDCGFRRFQIWSRRNVRTELFFLAINGTGEDVMPADCGLVFQQSVHYCP